MLLNQKKGNKIITVYLTSGELGSAKKSEKQTMKERESEAKKLCNAINAKYYFIRETEIFFSHKKDTLHKIIRILRTEKPHIVFYPHDKDDDPTHKQANELMELACKLCDKKGFFPDSEPWAIKKVLKYEVWTPIENYDYVVDVTSVIKSKQRLFEFYPSQLKIINYQEASISLNRYRGIMTGKGNYCEAFKTGI